DRKKDIIVTAGGKNITPAYIENKLKFSPWIQDAVVVGDRRKFIVALILIDEDNVTRYAQDHRIPFGTFADLTREPQVTKLMAAALPLFGQPAWIMRGTLIAIMAIGVLGQNLIVGYTGQISFGQAGFLAIGAYVFAHLQRAGFPWLAALLGGGLAAAAAGVVVGFPSLRLKGPYLAIATLGFGIAVYQLLANVEVLSGGRTGLALP